MIAENTPEAAPQGTRKTTSRAVAALLVLNAVLAAAFGLSAVLIVADLASRADEMAGGAEGPAPAVQPQEAGEAQAAHEHSWQPVYELVSHPATTHEVDHPAVMATRVEEHTVCNTCMKPVDGMTAEHAEEYGHAGYTTGVPVAVDYVEQEAWTETVVDAEAYDELVEVARACASCGERIPAQPEAAPTA